MSLLFLRILVVIIYLETEPVAKYPGFPGTQTRFVCVHKPHNLLTQKAVIKTLKFDFQQKYL